jgi:iron-sulfur cluster assembly protein
MDNNNKKLKCSTKSGESCCYINYRNLSLNSNFADMDFTLDNAIYVSDKAKVKVLQLMEEGGFANDPSYFLRVSVVGGGCSGLSYKMDFDNQQKPTDQVFENNGIKVVTDLKSLLYLVNTTLEFSEGLNGKGFYFNNPNASRTCACGESFAV